VRKAEKLSLYIEPNIEEIIESTKDNSKWGKISNRLDKIRKDLSLWK